MPILSDTHDHRHLFAMPRDKLWPLDLNGPDQRSASRTVDLVVGADGLHSGVRRLALGAESRFVRHLGFYLAGWDLPNDLNAGPTPQQYNVPGRRASIRADLRHPDRATAFVVFASPLVNCDWHDVEQHEELIIDTFTGLRWHAPHLLDALHDAQDVYFDSISRVAAALRARAR